MAKDVLKNVAVRGIVCCVPENIVEIDGFREEMGEKNIEKFKKTTGIQRKHCCTEDNIITAGDLCYVAAEKLITELDIDRETIDAVLLVTQSPDYIQPSTACVLQHRLGLRRECLAFDINLGCSGYVYGLHLAASYLQSGNLKRILLLAGEANCHAAPTEHLLFGEAGSATLIEYNEGNEMKFILRTMGEGFRNLIMPYGAYRHGSRGRVDAAIAGHDNFTGNLEGIEVFNFSVKETPALLHDYYEAFDCCSEDFDVFILHQANLMILQQIIKKMKLPKEKCPISIDIYGNTSSASIPLGICDYFHRIYPMGPSAAKSTQKKIAVCGFGIGLSLGVTSFCIDENTCFPVITTNEAFEDGVI